MSVVVLGEAQVLRSLNGAKSRFDHGRRQAAHLAGGILVRQLHKGMMNGAKSGRVYNGHQASAPGEYSANVTGALMKSFDYRVQSPSQFVFYSSGVEHAIYQELGTKNMAARPNLGNSVRDSRGKVRQVLGEVVYRNLRG